MSKYTEEELKKELETQDSKFQIAEYNLKLLLLSLISNPCNLSFVEILLLTPGTAVSYAARFIYAKARAEAFGR